ncbi:MAG: PD40 domain-containing protein, partial [Candidatus Latescibacteria bacterium]|nr:PD40 domain-containing protein [Candidatus Latescibacterota bacterium]
MFSKLNNKSFLREIYSTICLCLFVVFFFLTPHNAHAINRIDTKYFTIIYDDDGEYTAGEIAKFCDDIYEKLMGNFDAYEDNPRVICLVNDAVDLANGYAIYYQNTITIYATNMDFELRGQSNWLKNVFVHEMTHMVALKKAARGPINLVGIGGGRYDENPDIDVDIALYHLSQPAWFSEGMAQTGAETFGSEKWDTHRDMLLRSAWYEQSLLTYDEMSVLSGQKGMEAEMVYNQGYAVVRYIKEKYGLDKVTELNNSSGYFDFDPTIRNVLGISPTKLYTDWYKSLDNRYASYKDKSFSEGEMVQDSGSTDYFPVVSPDGKYLAWLSNRGKDYAITDLMLTDLSSGKTRRLVDEVDYRISWSHDSQKLLYVKRPPQRPNFYDIYTYNIVTNREKRISKQMRAVDPNFSPGDSLVVFVRNEGGNNSLAIINSDGSGLRYLTLTHDGTQFYRPSFSPDG